MTPSIASDSSDEAPANNMTKTPDPKRFSGKRSEVDHFILGVRIKIESEPEKLNTERKRILYMVSLFEKNALTWVAPMVEEYLSMDTEDQAMTTRRTLGSSALLMQAIKDNFGDQNAVAAAERALQTIKQRGSIQEYNAKFQTYAFRVQWNSDKPLLAFYKAGLRQDVKLALIARGLPTTFVELRQVATEISENLYEAKKNTNIFHQKPTHQGDPMEIDALESRRTKKKRVKCYQCGKLGHKKAQCEQEEDEGIAISALTSYEAKSLTEQDDELQERARATSAHNSLHWTACNVDDCWVHLSGKNTGYFPKKRKERPVRCYNGWKRAMTERDWDVASKVPPQLQGKEILKIENVTINGITTAPIPAFLIAGTIKNEISSSAVAQFKIKLQPASYRQTIGDQPISEGTIRIATSTKEKERQFLVTQSDRLFVTLGAREQPYGHYGYLGGIEDERSHPSILKRTGKYAIETVNAVAWYNYYKIMTKVEHERPVRYIQEIFDTYRSNSFDIRRSELYEAIVSQQDYLKEHRIGNRALLEPIDWTDYFQKEPSEPSNSLGTPTLDMRSGNRSDHSEGVVDTTAEKSAEKISELVSTEVRSQGGSEDETALNEGREDWAVEDFLVSEAVDEPTNTGDSDIEWALEDAPLTEYDGWDPDRPTGLFGDTGSPSWSDCPDSD